jgi:NADH-ubiquinone oxidoreductase chain 6
MFIYKEITFAGYQALSLDLLYVAAALFGIFVIISKNPITSVLYLIGLFLSISVYLMLTGLTFIGLSYLLVYIGAVSILFLFILMLINVRISELLIDSINSIPLAFLLGGFFHYFINYALPYMLKTYNNFLHSFISNIKLANVTSPLWDGFMGEDSHITSIGNMIYTHYAILLILVSFILLLAMVGCIVITLKEKSALYNSPKPYGFTKGDLKANVASLCVAGEIIISKPICGGTGIEDFIPKPICGGTGIPLKVIEYIDHLPLPSSEWLLSMDLVSYTWPFIGILTLGCVSWVAIESLIGIIHLSGPDRNTEWGWRGPYVSPTGHRWRFGPNGEFINMDPIDHEPTSRDGILIGEYTGVIGNDPRNRPANGTSTNGAANGTSTNGAANGTGGGNGSNPGNGQGGNNGSNNHGNGQGGANGQTV